MKSPTIIEGKPFPWSEPNPHGEVVDADGEVNWAAAAFADPGVMTCPKCGVFLWSEGLRVRCPDCNHEWDTRNKTQLEGVIVDLRDENATLKAEVERLRAFGEKVNAIRNSIVGAQALNWSEHAYPLVAALDAAGFEGQPYPEARKNVGTLIERATEAEARLAKCVGALTVLVGKCGPGCLTPGHSEAHDALAAVKECR